MNPAIYLPGTRASRAAAQSMPENRVCANCNFFENGAHFLEQAVPGLIVMSSGYAAVRWHDGLCTHHRRYLTAASTCAQYSRRGGGSAATAPCAGPDQWPQT